MRCGWDVKIKSNGESKMAESKAALCYGFAIALRALFVGDFALFPLPGGGGVGGGLSC